MKPIRIQRRRTKGWRMPEGAIYVGRPTFFGNDWRVPPSTPAHAVAMYRANAELFMATTAPTTSTHPRAQPVLAGHHAEFRSRVESLRGHDLACWCPLDQPCHADVLLELANA